MEKLGEHSVSKLGEFLEKALEDPFTYVVGLKSGKVIYFEMATYDRNRPDWITLCPTRPPHSDFVHNIVDPAMVRPPINARGASALFSFDRGIEVRLDAIEWCADAAGYDS